MHVQLEYKVVSFAKCLCFRFGLLRFFKAVDFIMHIFALSTIVLKRTYNSFVEISTTHDC